MRRRILLLITDLEIGGTPTVVRELALRLRNADQNIHVEVACLAKWGPVATQLTQAGVHVTALGARGIWDFPRTLHRLNHLLRARLIDTCFSFLVHANAMAATSKLFLPDVRHFQSIQTTQPNPRWHWTLQRLVHRAAETIVVPSESVAEVSQKWTGIPAGKIVVIPNAVDVEALAGIGSQGRTPTKERIGFIGRLDPVKQVSDLIEAMRFLDTHYELHIYGEGQERTKLQSLLEKLELKNRATLHGRVITPAIALAEMDILVLPSSAEGFGIVLIEAMAAGVPVVGTDVPGIREVVRDGVTGLLVPVASPAQLAAGMKRIAEDNKLRETLMAAAKEEVTRRFTWPGVVSKYRAVLKLE